MYSRWSVWIPVALLNGVWAFLRMGIGLIRWLLIAVIGFTYGGEALHHTSILFGFDMELFQVHT